MCVCACAHACVRSFMTAHIEVISLVSLVWQGGSGYLDGQLELFMLPLELLGL